MIGFTIKDWYITGNDVFQISLNIVLFSTMKIKITTNTAVDKQYYKIYMNIKNAVPSKITTLSY